MSKRKNIAVVGAGISGLACAYELKKAGLDVTVFEKEDYVGGRMSSRKKDGLIFDIGADHLSHMYEQTMAYCKEFGILWHKMKFLDYGVVTKGKIKQIESVVGMVSQVRMAREFFKKKGVSDFFDLSNAAKYDTEDAYSYMLRKTGKEVADYLADGFTAAYQFHRADEISLGVLFSWIDSMTIYDLEWYLRYMEGGMSVLPEALANEVDVRTGTTAENVTGGDTVTLKTAAGSQEFDAVVLAATANVSLKILENPSESQQDVLKNTKYASTVSVSFRVLRDDLPEMGIVWVPYVENGSVSAYVNEFMKGEPLISTWLHEEFAKTIIGKSDDEIFELVKVELLKVCPWVGEGDLVNNDLQRWERAMPKFYKGHLKRVAKFLEDGHQGENNIFLCGDYMNSPWIEGSIRCGKRTANQLVEALR